jgi:DUF1680 family protein
MHSGTYSNMRAAVWTAALLLFAAAAASARPEPKGRRLLQPFDYRGVTLDGGSLRRQFDETRDYYLRIPDDDLLKGFRARAGRPAPGVDLGGWYSADVFHVFGQILSGLARMYAATGDPACRDKANALVSEWGKCIAPDGYFFFSAKPNAPHYIYDKMVGGLVDTYLYCGNREALTCLSRITDWAVKHLSRARPYGADSNEWYTLSENLYRAYLATGDPKYRDFAAVWEYTEYWNRYAQKAGIFDSKTGGYHAYSHVNTLGGAGAAYLVTGEPRYLNTLKNAYDYLQASQCFATGGYGPNESLLPREPLLRLLAETHNTFETQCGSWAAFKMAKYLISFTGDAKYGDWIERLVYNGIGASIPMSADGRVFYYSDYNLSGASKQNIGFGWSCCTGTRPMAVADYDDLVYFRDADGLYVNLYTPSTVRFVLHPPQSGKSGSTGLGIITVRQSTRFPESETTEFTVTTPHPASFLLALRAPGWLAGPMTVSVNGRPVRTRAERHWVMVRRVWKNGDRLTARLPMRFRAVRFDPARPYPAAIMRGPVVLAFRSPAGNPSRRVDVANLESALVPSAGESLTYHLASDPAALARPFYAFKDGEPYYLYLDPKAANRVTHRAVTFSEGWNDSGAFRFCNIVGATAEYAFEGTGIRWLGYRYDDAGRAEVRIDGKVVAVVDQFGPGRDLPFDWKYEGLPMGRHTIHLTLLSEKSAESKDRFLNVAGFEILRPDSR